MSDGLAHELKKIAGFDSPQQEVFLGIVRTAEVIARPFVELFKSAGISAAQYNVLRILRGAGESGLACQEIAQRMVNRDPDLTRLLDRLQAAALLGRQRDHIDRRVVITRITEAGLALLIKLDKPVHDLHIRQFAHLAPDQLRALSGLLDLARHGPLAASGDSHVSNVGETGDTP
jgi:DNA-binding MarR family transcriptional regulator